MKRQLLIIAAFALTSASLSIAHAQDAAPSDAAAPAAPATAAKTPAAGTPTPPVVAAKPDPAVDTIIDSNPQTPAQVLRAVGRLADLDRIDLAKKYLQQLAAAKVDEAALAEAAWQIDPGTLLRIAENKDLQPEGRQLSDAALAAAAKLTRDPQHLQADVNRLADPSRTVRFEALKNVLAAHEDAVPALVIALADKNRAAIHPVVKQTLAQIGPQAVPPLVTAVQSNDPALMVNVIDALSQIGSREAVVYLAAPATSESYPAEVRQAARTALDEIQGVKNPTRDDAVKLLTTAVQHHLNHDRPLSTDAAGNVAVWHWDANSKMPVRESLPPEHADAALAARSLGLDLIRLAPDDRLAKRLVTVSTLEHIAFSATSDGAQKRNELALVFNFGPADSGTIEDALAYAMQSGHLAAATAAAEILGNIGDASLLRAKDGVVRPLVKAVAQGDRRLRFAAAEAIMKFKPTEQFAGSSDMLTALVFFADSPGIRRAVVAFPNELIAGQLVTMLGTLGYEVDTATNGRRAFLQSISSGDYELILLSGQLDHPPVWVTLQQLRHEPATARLPIGLLAEPGDVPYLNSVASDDGSNRSPPRMRYGTIGPGGNYAYLPDSGFGDGQFTDAFERPITPEGMKFFIDRLTQRAGSDVVPSAVREKQAIAALQWLKQLNETSPRDFDLRPFKATFIRALQRPATSAAAAELLALDGSHMAQRALVELANMSTQPLEMRQSAAAVFSRAVRKYGIQLTSGEIRNQYDRYNLSAKEDPAVQQLLCLILDAIETPTKR